MRTFISDVVGKGNLSLLDELSQPDMVDEANVLFGGPSGRAGLVAHVKGFHKNIAKSKVRIHRIIGNETQVMCWWSFEGIHIGPWMNLAPTKEPVRATVFSFFSLRDNRISCYQLWLHADVSPHPTQVFDGRLEKS